MPSQNDTTRDSTRSDADRWAAESLFIGEATEEQQTPVVHQWYRAHSPFREERELEETYGPETEEEDFSAELGDEEAYEPTDETSELELYLEPLVGEDEYPVTQPVITERLLPEHFESLVEEAKALLDEVASGSRRYDVAAMSETEIEAFLDQYRPLETHLPQGYEYLLNDIQGMAKRVFKGAVNLSKLQTRLAELQPISPSHHASEREQGEIVEPEVEEPGEFVDELEEEFDEEVEEGIAREAFADFLADEEELEAVSSGEEAYIPASRLQWSEASQEQLEFMRRVYEKQVRRAARKRPFRGDVTKAELAVIEGGHKARIKVAAACRELLAAARTALYRQKREGVQQAQSVKSIYILSAYRSASRQFSNWQGNFPRYYRETRANRAAQKGGEHGEAATEYLARYIGRRLAAPGFSLHNSGLGVDLGTIEGGRKLGASTSASSISQWKESWLFGWLTENASRFNYYQNRSIEEPWHWEYREPAEGYNPQTLLEEQVGSGTIDLNRAVRENRRYEAQLGWRAYHDRFTRLLRFTNPVRGERELAKAIADWQRSQRSPDLTVDGIIGPETWLRMLTAMRAAGIWPPCVAPPVARDDPSALNVSPVGNLDYSGGTVTTSVGDTFPVEGTVFYPAERAGKGAPFNTRLAKQGPVPIVFIAHGMGGLFRDPNDPQKESKMLNPGGWIPVHSYKGYEYFQRLLAQMGIIAVSVDCNEINKLYVGSLWTEPIHQRAGLIIGSIRHFQALNSGRDPIFRGHIDFSKVGLMGHSQGGEAAVVVPEERALPRMDIPGVSIKGAIALAPTDSGALKRQPNGFAFMTILPAGDGDVSHNPGAKFYDDAIPDPFKCQLYVHHANHNYFNTEWRRSDGHGPSVMLPSDHQHILSVYGCAFFREVLLGHSLVKFLKGQEVPPGVAPSFIHISFELKGPVTVDDHENRDININTLRQRTKQSGGLTAKEFEFAQRTGAFNRTFFGETIGMVAQSNSATGQFRSPLVHNTDLTGREIWIRAAEVYNGTSVPAGATGFKLGLEDSSGMIAFVDSDDVGALPRPYDRRTADLAEPRIGQDLTKTMLKTLRFPTECFKHSYPGWNIKKVCAVVLRLDRGDGRALAFDQLQIVKP